jgi:hypothetical protein
VGSQKITMTITSTGGCTVTVDGTATWDGILNPTNFGFKGKLIFGGGAGCPSGTLEFKSASRPGDGARTGGGRQAIAVLDVSDPRELRTIIWHTEDKRAAALLNDPAANQALCARLRSAPDHERDAVPRT